jgi:hypothetical protein
MAKSDSFYIRAVGDAASGGAFAQKEIDLGSFVNLGVKSSTVMRIHNIAVQYADGTVAGGISPELPLHATAAGGGKIAFQLTTQTQSSLVDASDKSLVASGGLMLYGDPNGGTVASGDAVVAIVMECTLETATQASSTALALSQQ